MEKLSLSKIVNSDYPTVKKYFDNFDFSQCPFVNNYIFNFYFLMRRVSDVNSLSILMKIAERYSIYPKLNRECTDWKYLAVYSFLFDRDTRDRILHLNSETPLTDFEIEELERNLLGNKEYLNKFVKACIALYRTRYSSEYRFIKNDPIDFFPYKYLTDFSGKSDVINCKSNLKLTFVYCVKNRSSRAKLSLKTLFNAYNKYTLKSNRLQLEILVVEDFGTDLIGEIDYENFTGDLTHFVISTGCTWTRAGTLNYGIKRASGDVVAFCDVDFIFHDDFFTAAEEPLLKFDFTSNILTVNCIETCNHRKGNRIYSKASPYGYMWLINTHLANQAGGFSEEYVGHGFEDRDFQFKMANLYDLKIFDSISLEADFCVLHLSHNERTGNENRDTNKTILDEKFKNLTFTVQENWGEFPLISKRVIKKGAVEKSDGRMEPYDIIFLAHNSYHAWTYQILKSEMDKAGLRTILISPLPDYQDEGVETFCLKNKIPFLRIGDFKKFGIDSLSLVVFNDWDKKVSNPLVQCFNSSGKKTIGLIEGINDYNDVDTGRTRSAYRTVSHVLIPGDFDRRNYFSDFDDRAHVVGIPRLKKITPKEKDSKLKPMVLINSNFTYGVLEEHRDDWVEECVNACKLNGLDYVISVHHADRGDYSKYNISKRTFYEDLNDCSLMISRFSSCIIESLVAGVPVIYYNNGFEKVFKFQEPNGAYSYIKKFPDLVHEVEKLISSKPDVIAISEFLNDHALFSSDPNVEIVRAFQNILKKE